MRISNIVLIAMTLTTYTQRVPDADSSTYLDRTYLLGGSVTVADSDDVREVRTVLYRKVDKGWNVVDTQVCKQDGSFTYDKLPDGIYVLVVLPSVGTAGYYPRVIRGPFVLDRDTDDLIVRITAGTRVDGVYMRDNHGVEHAEITLWKPVEPEFFAVRTYTRSDGAFTFLSVEKGAYSLMVRNYIGGELSYVTSIVLNCDTNISIQIRGDVGGIRDVH